MMKAKKPQLTHEDAAEAMAARAARKALGPARQASISVPQGLYDLAQQRGGMTAFVNQMYLRLYGKAEDESRMECDHVIVTAV